MIAYSTVGAPYWDDAPVAIIGGGTSLCGFDLNRFRDLKCHVLAVNASMFDIDFADAGFGLDALAFRDWLGAFAKVPYPIYYATEDHRVGRTPVADIPANVVFIRRRGKVTDLSDDPAFIEAGGSSGFGALGLAYLKRAKFIVLFGFDYGSSATGEWHHNEKHYRPRGRNIANWRAWARNFENARAQLDAAGVTVLNASPDSNIKAFEKVTIEEGLTRIMSLTAHIASMTSHSEVAA